MALSTRPNGTGRFTVADSSRSDGAPRRKSLLDWLNLVKGARSDNAFVGSGQPSRHQCQKALETVYKSGYVEKAAMAETSAQAGGYLLPVEYSTKMLKALVEDSFIFPRAARLDMSTLELQVPTVDVVTLQSKGVNALFGGLNFTWGFSQTPAETENTFKQTQLHAWDLLGYCVVSNQWLEDSGSPGRVHETANRGAEEQSIIASSSDDFLIKIFAKAASWHAEYAFLQGLGGNQQMPLGILNAPATIKVNRAGASAIAISDIGSMTSSLLPYSFRNAIWACSPTALSKIQQLGSYFINIELGDRWHDDTPRPCGVISTLPLFVSDKLAPMGTPGDVVLIDPSLYCVGLRQEIVVDFSSHDAFRNNQSTFRVWFRCDGLPLISGSARLVDASTKVSPYVMLN